MRQKWSQNFGKLIKVQEEEASIIVVKGNTEYQFLETFIGEKEKRKVEEALRRHMDFMAVLLKFWRNVGGK